MVFRKVVFVSLLLFCSIVFAQNDLAKVKLATTSYNSGGIVVYDNVYSELRISRITLNSLLDSQKGLQNRISEQDKKIKELENTISNLMRTLEDSKRALKQAESDIKDLQRKVK